jgi:lipoyl(octanoyl) transferase
MNRCLLTFPDEVRSPGLQVYLLDTVDFATALTLQRRLVYEIAEDRRRAALIVCQHPPLITVGRQGSFRHILCDPDEMRSRRWQMRWVNRGGGCVLHLPGQLAIYPIVALDRLRLGPSDYLHRLHKVIITLLADFTVRGEVRPRQAGIWVRARPIATFGVAIRDWVTYYGVALNVNPALEPFQLVRCGGPDEPPMTSLERERKAPVRPSLVRQQLVQHFADHFGFAQTYVFTDHPILKDGFRLRSPVPKPGLLAPYCQRVTIPPNGE